MQIELNAATYAPWGNLATASIKIEVHRGRELRPSSPVARSTAGRRGRVGVLRVRARVCVPPASPIGGGGARLALYFYK